MDIKDLRARAVSWAIKHPRGAVNTILALIMLGIVTWGFVLGVVLAGC